MKHRRVCTQRGEEPSGRWRQDEDSVLGSLYCFFHSHRLHTAGPCPAVRYAPGGAGRISYIDEDGTAYITRIVPVPQTVSSEAQKSLARQATHAASHEPPA